MKRHSYLAILAAFLLAVAGLAFAQEDYFGQQAADQTSATPSRADHPTVGNTGHLALKQETEVGEALLPPGDYQVRHRPSATGHFVEFRLVSKDDAASRRQRSKVVADVPCLMKSLHRPVTHTYAEMSSGKLVHLRALRIRGEDVLHTFDQGPDPSAPQNQLEYGGGGM